MVSNHELMIVRSTIDPGDAVLRIWDIIVIGAGPAGSTAAMLLARAGAKVLIVERSQFPRAKVCGCCLSGRSISSLRQMGLAEILNDATPLDRFVMGACRRQVSLSVHGGSVISRERLDTALLKAAISSGAELISGLSATVSAASNDWRTVTLSAAKTDGEILRARLVLSCRGLSHHGIDGSCLQETVATNSKIGVAAILPEHPAFFPSTIYMASGNEGYLGLVRLEDGRLNMAAAIKSKATNRHGGLPGVIHALLDQAGFPVPRNLEGADWKGTPALTRSLRVPAEHRVFFLGDEAGYVEPFTGEGIGWAFACARAVLPLAQLAIKPLGR